MEKNYLNKDKNEKLKKLIVKYLQPKERITLEMIVLDSDKDGTADFLSGYGLKIKDSEAIVYCKKWLKNIERGEQGRLNIRFSDKGPGMDLK